MPADVLRMEAVHKRFAGGRPVLDGLSLSVDRGDIYGFLGPNGSGKTTTVRVLNGVLPVDAGGVWVDGRPVAELGVDLHRRCGVLTETAATYEHLGPLENLRFFGRLFGMASPDVETRARDLLGRLDLWDHRDKPVKVFSTGMRKRMALARALLHRPDILFLDEPTSGLDPESARNVVDLVHQLRRESGVTVFLCTHQLRDAQDLCTRYGFIHGGRVLGQGTFEELLSMRGHVPQLEVRGTLLPVEHAGPEVAPGVHRRPLPDPEETSAILGRILGAGGRVHEVRQVRWTLEELYFSFVEAARAV